MSLPEITGEKYPGQKAKAERIRKTMKDDIEGDDGQELRASLVEVDPALGLLFDKAVKALLAQTSAQVWTDINATADRMIPAFMRNIDPQLMSQPKAKNLSEAVASYDKFFKHPGLVKLPDEPIVEQPVKPKEPALEVKSGYEGLYEARSFVVAQDMQQKALGAIQTTLMNQFAAGVTTRDAVKALNETFASLAAGQLISPGTPGYDFTKPAIQETTVRTLYNDAMNGGRNEVYEANSDFVKGTERSEVLDSRNHPLSKIVDGLKIKLSDPRRRRLTGSLHFNDRGVDIPITAVDAMKPGFEWSSDSEIDNAISKGKQLSPRFF